MHAVRTPRLALALALALAGCNGQIGEPATSPGSGADPGGAGPGAALTCDDDVLYVDGVPLRRLSHTEYLNSVAALFPRSVAPDLPTLPEDAAVRGFENDASALGPSELLVDRYEEVAFRTTDALTADPDALAAFLPCDRWDTDAEQTACGEAFVDDFGLRTHRRPLTEEEQATFGAFFEAQRVAIDFEAAVQLTAMAMLQAPQFLYRVELSTGATDEVAPLDAWELASRLSFLLWESGPDDELFDLAAADALADPETLEAQARRMLDDPRARATVVNFHRQWLDFDRILAEEHRTRVDEVHAGWDETLQRSVREESDRFVEHTFFEGAGTLGALFTSRTTYVNGPLAELYGVPGPADASTWERVELPAAERGGILTQASFLASHAHRANGSPPLRGVFVLERVLCTPPPPPPPEADITPPTVAPGEAPRTNRELFEERTSPAGCQSCHTVIDGFGFPFEHYDAAGAYRSEDRGLPVDATGWATGTDFDGPVADARELGERLAGSEQVQACAVENWLRHAHGRPPTTHEACQTQRLRDAFSEAGGDLRELLVALVTAPEFRFRRVVEREGAEGETE